MKKIKIILGLGNYNKKYSFTYHNLGHLFIDWLKEKWQINLEFKKEKKLLSEVLIFPPKNIILAKNLNYMNESYKSVKLLKNFYSLELNEFLIIHDDSDIPISQFKICFNRGSAGHKGIESIIKNLGKDFYRIRIGIRNPKEKIRKKAGSLVLKKMPLSEREIFFKVFSKIEKQILNFFLL